MVRKLIFLMACIAAVHLSFAQQPVITLGDYSKNLLDGSIFYYNEENKEIYTFYFNDVTRKLHLHCFDTEFNTKASSVTKIKAGYDKPIILDVRKNGSHIDVVTEEGRDIVHYTFDSNSLQNTSTSNLFRNPGQRQIKIQSTEVRWSSNGEYVAIVFCENPSTEPGNMTLKYIDFDYNIYLYDKDFHLLKQSSFPYMQFRLHSNQFCRTAWTLTDNGEVVYAAIHYTTKPKKHPEYGESGCRIEAKIISKDAVKEYVTPNANPGGLIVSTVTDRYVLLKSCGNIEKYDGEKMQVFFSNVLYQYDFKSQSATPLCRFQYYLSANSSTGLSLSFDDGNGGYAICSGRSFVWIKGDPLKSRIGTWGNANVQTDSNFFFPRIDAYSSEVTFFYNNHLYHIDNIVEGGLFRRSKYKGAQLLCIDENGSVSNLKISSNARSDLDFYHISGTRYLVCEQETKIGKEYMQRFGLFELK